MRTPLFALFDYLVGAEEEGQRNCDAERLRRSEVDDRGERRWLSDPQARLLVALQESPSINFKSLVRTLKAGIESARTAGPSRFARSVAVLCLRRPRRAHTDGIYRRSNPLSSRATASKMFDSLGNPDKAG
jgi:hypothetical protein